MIWKRHVNYITAICNFDFSISKGVSHIFPSYFREKKSSSNSDKNIKKPCTTSIKIKLYTLQVSPCR